MSLQWAVQAVRKRLMGSRKPSFVCRSVFGLTRAGGCGSAGLVFLGSHSGSSVVVEVPAAAVAACPISNNGVRWRVLQPGAIENLAPGCNPILFEDPPGGSDLPVACFVVAGCGESCTGPHLCRSLKV